MDRQTINGGQSPFATILPSRSLLYLTNSFFLIILAFVAGYNFKGYQVRRDLAVHMGESDKYIQEMKDNFEKSREILKDMSETYQVHYEKKIEPGVLALNVPEGHVGTLEISQPAPAKPAVDTPPPAPVPAKPSVVVPPPAVEAAPAVPVPVAAVPKAAPVQPPPPPRAKPKQAYPDIPFVHVNHRVQQGDILSALVSRRDMDIFLQENPSITQPDLIFPGQEIVIRIPMTNIKRGSYMNKYFVRSDGKSSYRLLNWLYIPEDTSVMSFLIHEQKLRIQRKTTPFIDLTRETNLIKDKSLASRPGHFNTLSRITRVPAAHGPMLFQTMLVNPQLFQAPYKGVRETDSGDFTLLNDALVKNLYHFYSVVNEKALQKTPYHFFVFGDTVVQVSYLNPDHFVDTSGKERIYIGVAHKNRHTNRALGTLKQALGICRVEQGSMAEITPSNLSLFLR